MVMNCVGLNLILSYIDRAVQYRVRGGGERLTAIIQPETKKKPEQAKKKKTARKRRKTTKKKKKKTKTRPQNTQRTILSGASDAVSGRKSTILDFQILSQGTGLGSWVGQRNILLVTEKELHEGRVAYGAVPKLEKTLSTMRQRKT